MSIEFAVFGIEHYEAARALWERTEGVGLSDADAKREIQLFLERNPMLSFAALDAGELVGTILVGHDGRRGLIHHLAVSTASRRYGIGTKLVRLGLNALVSTGIQKCHLLVFSHNTSGREFWRAVGAEHRDTLAIYSLATAYKA